jgi:hypothetical protein
MGIVINMCVAQDKHQWQDLQGEEGHETSETSTNNVDRVGIGTSGRGRGGRARAGLRGSGVGSSTGSRRASSAGGVGSVAGTAGTSGSTGSRGNSLAGREVVGDAALDASRELVAVLLGAVTLVALLGALGGVDHIGSVGVSSTQAGSLAGYIASIAVVDAADGGEELGCRGGGGSAGNGRSVLRNGEDAGGEGKNGNSVLHFAGLTA